MGLFYTKNNLVIVNEISIMSEKDFIDMELLQRNNNMASFF